MTAFVEFEGKRWPVPEVFTNRDFIRICRVGDIDPHRLDEFRERGDFGFAIGVAVVAAEHAGDHSAAQRMLNAEVGTVRLVGEEVEAVPPVEAPSGAAPVDPSSVSPSVPVGAPR